MTDKRVLRARLRAERDAFAAGRPPLAVPDALAARFAPDLVIASYQPLGGEADPALLIEAARNAGCTIALPYVTSRAEPLHFVAWNAGDPLETGPFGLRQPAAGDAVAPDIVLTPLVAFDRALHRVGQGAGHYDRAFAAHPAAWRVGIAWSIQQVPPLTPDPWDVPLHAVLTEQEWITS